jgi:hypothetical protein
VSDVFRLSRGLYCYLNLTIRVEALAFLGAWGLTSLVRNHRDTLDSSTSNNRSTRPNNIMSISDLPCDPVRG